MEAQNERDALRPRIWELIHLVNATTHGLSMCLSLNDLLHAAKSAEDEALTRMYSMCLDLSIKALANFAPRCAILSDTTPETLPHSGASDKGTESHAYQHLIVAASVSRQIAPLLRLLEGQEVKHVRQVTSTGYLEARHVAEFEGWPKCYELDDLQGICKELLAYRETEGGWKTCWRTWSTAIGQ